MIFDGLQVLKKDFKLKGLSMKTYDFHLPSASSNLAKNLSLLQNHLKFFIKASIFYFF